jgi:RNA polymerase sigma-70 factor (ECF subfamily)
MGKSSMESVVDLRWLGRHLHQMNSASTAMVVSPDAGLVSQARDGDHEAFAHLHRAYAPMVHGILLARVPRGEVDDLAQDVFMLAIQRLPSLRDDNAFGGWLAAIARNRATDFHRQKRDEIELLDDAVSDPSSHNDSEAAHVLMLVRSLPEAYRETLVLRLVEGMTGPEIAERTGLTPGSVRVNLHRGMQMLREKLGWSK